MEGAQRIGFGFGSDTASPAAEGVGEPRTLVVAERRVCVATMRGASCQTLQPGWRAEEEEGFELTMPARGGAAGLFAAEDGTLFAVDVLGSLHGFDADGEARLAEASAAASAGVVALDLRGDTGCLRTVYGLGRCWGARDELGLPWRVPEVAPVRIEPPITGRLERHGSMTCFAKPDDTSCWVVDRDRLSVDAHVSGERRPLAELWQTHELACRREGDDLRCGPTIYEDVLAESGGVAITRSGQLVGTVLMRGLTLNTEMAARLQL